MKRIGIDARLYYQTGVGVYLRNLLHELENIDTTGYEFYLYVMAKDSPSIIFRKKTFVKREVTFSWHGISEQIGFLQYLNHDKLDLMHFTYFSYPILYHHPFIATVHDVTPLKFKTGKVSTKNLFFYWIKHFVFSLVLKVQVKRALSIITPTETIKHELAEIYGEDISKKTQVLYEGINTELKNVGKNTELAKHFPGDFFIYIGNFYPHKNVEKLIDAYLKVRTSIPLILVGPNDFFADKITKKIYAHNATKKIVMYHISSPNELAFFYEHAKALIHPSLSEGFGLPIVEAMYFKLPIIASNIEVFRELLGKNYMQFDPRDEAAIKKAIEDFLKNSPSFKYDHLLSRYSFSVMAVNTLKLYQKAFQELYEKSRKNSNRI